jgi:hypothetical protein
VNQTGQLFKKKFFDWKHGLDCDEMNICEEILKNFTLAEQAVIMSVPAANNVEDLTKFASISKYFRGEHHREEMMYHENCPRSVLLQLIDNFRQVLVKSP